MRPLPQKRCLIRPLVVKNFGLKLQEAEYSVGLGPKLPRMSTPKVDFDQEQIKNRGKLEISSSGHVNPVTIVYLETIQGGAA